MPKKPEDVKGYPYPTAKRYKPSANDKGFLRIQVTLDEMTFDNLRDSAVENNRSISMEARNMIQAAIRAQKFK